MRELINNIRTLTALISKFPVNVLQLAGGIMTGLIQGAKSANIASATATDLSVATGNFAHITGSVTITSFTVTTLGTYYDLIIDAAPLITNNANIVIPGGANIQAAAGDRMRLISDTAGVVNIVSYTKSSGAAIISSGVFTANKIYIDSTYGVNATGAVGDATKPYLTREYVNANTTNTGTLTVGTTSASYSLTAASTTGIVVGQYITGTGIPFGTQVVSFVANTSILMSKPATATASITATWWTIYEVIYSGNFVATSNYFKQGYYEGESISASIIWGDIYLYDFGSTAQVIPYINRFGGRYISTVTTAKDGHFFKNDVAVQNTLFICVFEFDSIISKTTGNLIIGAYSSSSQVGRYYMKGNTVTCTVGSFSLRGTGGAAEFHFDIGYLYVLIHAIGWGAVATQGSYRGDIEAGNQQFLTTTSTMSFSGRITGAGYCTVGGATIAGAKAFFNCDYMEGSSFTCSNIDVNGGITAPITMSGGVDLRGTYWSATALVSSSAGTSPGNRIYASFQNGGGLTCNSGYTSVYSDSFTPGGITINSGAVVTMYGKAVIPATYTRVNAGGTLYNMGKFTGYIDDLSGTLINHGIMNIINSSGLMIQMKAGCVLKNYGEINGTSAATGYPTIQKVGGRLELWPGSKLTVLNGKSPINCTLNTADSKDIYMYHVVTNCDGSTYGVLILFAGGGYAPNDLVGGLKYENTIF